MTGSRALRLGTRRSNLALTQSGMVADSIRQLTGEEVELVPIVSAGDTSRAALAQLGGTGVFATRLREALARDECDLLVHSLKDLPTAAAPGLVVAAIPARADARDVLVTRGAALAELPDGARIGTGSPRRIAQLLRVRPGLQPVGLRGNVDSRLERVVTGELDAVILAAAGLERLGILGHTDGLSFEALDLLEWPTAAGQGALAVEIREDAAERVAVAVQRVDDLPTRIAVTAERTLLAALEAGCHAPVGVTATVAVGGPGGLSLRARVYAADGGEALGVDPVSVPLATGREQSLRAAEETGRSAAEQLLRAGAGRLVSETSLAGSAATDPPLFAGEPEANESGS